MRRLSLLLALPLLLVACRTELVEPRDDGSARVTPAPRLTGNQAADRATLQGLEKAAMALAHTDGCSSADECRSAPVGAKACGGPRYYLPYCPVTTDEDALRRQLAEVEKFERAFNDRYRIASTCDLATPPPLEVSGGACHDARR